MRDLPLPVLTKCCCPSIHSPESVVVDIDQSGLLASGKTYEFASKGYFPNKTGKKGYQLSVAFAGEHSEVVDLYLDPGNTHCQYRFDDLLSSITSKYIDHLKYDIFNLRVKFFAIFRIK